MMGSETLERVAGTGESAQPEEDGDAENGETEDAPSGQVSTRATEMDLIGGDVNDRVAGEESINYDQLFELLKNKRRRRVLEYLLDVDDEITLDVLAEQIAAEENGKDVKQITSQERKRVYVGLYQCHLPKMDDWGAITYNKPRGKISTAENTELFAHYLPDQTEDVESGWGRYRLALPLALALFFLTAVILGGVGLISMVQLVAVSLVATSISVAMLLFSW